MTEYEHYLSKIKKFSRFVPAIRKFLIVLGSVLGGLLLSAVIVLLCVGTFVKKVSCEDITYGNPVQPSARAFLSPVSYLFCENGTDYWQESAPVTVGNYTVKAISNTIFKKERTSVANFSILKREITVSAEETTLTFGDKSVFPVLSGDLVSTDHFSAQFVPDWDSLRVGDSTLHLSANDIRIFDSNNDDRTYNYSILGSTIDIPVRIFPKEITLSAKSETIEYDGNPHCVSQYDILSGSLAEDHVLSVVLNGERTDIGSTPITLSDPVITDKNGNDLTSEYEITLVPGSLNISARTICLTVCDAEKEFDGTPLECPEFKITDGTLLSGDELSVVISGSICTPGQSENSLSSWTVKRGAEDVSSNYLITAKPGTLTVKKRNITVKTSDYSAVYNGKEQQSTDFDLISGNLNTGETISVTEAASIRDVGEKPNDLVLSITYADGENRTDYYNILYETGTLTVTPLPITVKAELDSDFLYTGKKFDQVKYSVISKTQPLAGHKLQLSILTEILFPGDYFPEYSVRILDSSDDVTNNYDISIVADPVTIKKRPLTLESASTENLISRTMEPEPIQLIENSSVNFLKENGFEIILSTDESENDIGSTLNAFSAVITQKSMNAPVTQYFDITYVFGKRKWIKRDILLKSLDSSKEYDGFPLTRPEYDILSGTLMPEDELKIEFSGTQTKIGSSKNTFSFRIIESSTGEDVTDKYYHTETQFGTLTVTEPQQGSGSGQGSGFEQDPEFSMNNSPYGKEDPPAFYKVKSDVSDTLYIKEKSYGDFNGINLWKQALDYFPGSDFILSPIRFSALWSLNAGFKSHTVEIASIDGSEFSSNLLPYYSLKDEVNEESDVFVSLSGKNNYQYEFFSPTIEDFFNWSGKLELPQQFLAEESAYQEFVYDNYLSVPEQTKTVLLQLASEANIRADDPDVIQKVQHYIQNAATYNLEFPPIPEGKDMVVYFLTESKEGICQHYAAAATLMYRSLGIPSRYTVGYLVNTSANEWVEVKPKKTGHAWTEIYFAGIGWIKVEVTGSSPSGPVDNPGNETDLSDSGDPSEASQSSANDFLRSNSDIQSDQITINQDELGIEVEVPVKSGMLIDGDRLLCTYSVDQFAAGEQPAICQSFRIVDSEGNDVTDQYQSVQGTNGFVQLEPIFISLPQTIEFASSFGMDLMDLISPTIPRYADLNIIKNNLPLKSLNNELQLDDCFVWATKTGTYQLIMNDNQIDVNGDDSVDYIFVGTNVSAEALSVSNTEQMTLSVDDAISQGILDMSYKNNTQYLYDRNGRKYNLLYIQISPLTVDYNGSLMESNDYSILTGKLYSGHKLTLKGNCSARFSGTYDNGFNMLTITDADGLDVTSQYLVRVFPGTIEINPSVEEKNTEQTINIWSSLQLKDLLNKIWNGPYDWDSSFEDAKGVLFEKDGAVFARKPGKAQITASSSIDLNNDGISEYIMQTTILMIIRIPPVVIVLASVFVLAAIVLALTKIKKRRR